MDLLSLLLSGASPHRSEENSAENVRKELEKRNKSVEKKLERLKKAKTLPKDVKKLHAAARKGNHSKCSQLLTMGTDANSRGVFNETRLCGAAIGGHTDLLRLFLRHKADLNAQDDDGDTPLMYAIIAGKLAFARALLDNNESQVSLDVRNKAGKTVIEKAFRAGNEEAVKILAEKGASFTCSEKRHKKQLFKYATEGNIFLIKFWFSQHSQPKDVINMTFRSRTLALVASLNGNLDIVKFLCDNGINLDFPDEDGDTPLFCAAQNGFAEIVDFLVFQRCNINHRNKAGRTPIFSALGNMHLDIVKYLHSHGASLNVTDKENTSLLFLSIASGSTEAFNYLCKKLPGDCLQFNAVTTDGETCLLAASQTSNFVVFKTLLEKNVALNHRNKSGISAALRAAYNNQIEMVRLLYEYQADLDLPDKNNVTAIICAAQRNNLMLLKFLVGTKKCNVSAEDCNGQTLIYFAVKNKNTEMLRFLIDSGAPPDIPDVSGNTPLIVAVYEDCIEAVQQLVETRRVDLSRRNTKGHTPALLSVHNKSEQMLKYLVDMNFETDISDRYGDTPLLLAVKKNKYKLVKLLASRKGIECDSNTTDKTGKTCLHAAVANKNPALISRLCSMGAVLDKADKKGNTPFLASAKTDSACLHLLSAKGSDVNRRNKDGKNAARVSISHRQSNVVVILEALGCCLDAEDANGDAPIHVAAAEGESLVAEFLIEHGILMNLPNRDGNTPAHLACKKGSSDALKCLLEYNVALKVQNDKKQTELMFACMSSNGESIDLLLRYYNKYDINLQDIDGKTALHYAVESRQHEMIRRLVEAGADVNIPDQDGVTPGLRAAKTCQWNVLNEAFEALIDVEIKTRSAESVAHFAASGADLKTLEKLKEINVPLTDLTLDEDSCLTLAASKGSVQVCDFLIREGNRKDHCNKNGESAICKAAQASHSELFFHLAHNEADFLQKDRAGNSSLYYFIDKVEKLDQNAVSQLIAPFREEELVDLDSQGFGLCHLAAMKGCLKLLRDLHDRGWDLTKATASGETCITLAAGASDSGTLEFLLGIARTQMGNPDSTEQESQSGMDQMKRQLERAFRIRAGLGKTELMSELLSTGIDSNASDEEGNTALIISCEKMHPEFAISLLSKESVPPVDVNRVNHKGFAAIHHACKNQLTECVEQLLKKARIDLVNSDGYTCLHEAMTGDDSTDVAELLIDSGCDVSAKTANGDNSLMLALKNGSLHLSRLLIRRGGTIDPKSLPTQLVVKKLLSRGRREVVFWLLEQGVDLNKFDSKSRHVLFDVVDHGAAEILEAFIDKGADIECKDERGFTPFLHSILNGREDLAKILIDKCCNTEARASNGFDCVLTAVSARRLYTLKWIFDHVSGLRNRQHAEVNGQTALHLCGKLGHPQMFSFLITNGFEITRECENSWTPIDYAIAEGNLEVLKTLDEGCNRRLLEIRMEKSLSWTADSPSPIAVAAANGCENVFKFFHSIGINCENMSIALPAACAQGQQNIVRYLCSIQIDVAGYRNAKSGTTALLSATESSNLHLVKFLIEKLGCDVKAACFKRNTVVQRAVTRNQERILNYVISKGAPVDEPNAEGDTPLMEAALLGHQRMMEILLDHSCDIHRQNNQKRNAIHIAVTKLDNPELVKFLMDRGVSVDATDDNGNTACMIASYLGHLQAVKLFLEQDRSLGTGLNSDGCTPALLAAMKGKHEVLQLLADKDCLRTEDADKDGTTLLMLAIQSGSVSTVKSLLDMGICNRTAVNSNGIGVKTLAMNCRNVEMRQLLSEHGILDTESAMPDSLPNAAPTADRSETNETNIAVGHHIRLMVYTPDTPPTVRIEEDLHRQYDELENAASEIQNLNYPASLSSATRSALAHLRHDNPEPVNDGYARAGAVNQVRSLLAHSATSAMDDNSSIRGAARISDIGNEARSAAS